MHLFVRTSLALAAIAAIAAAGVKIAPPNPDDAWADPDPKPIFRVPPKHPIRESWQAYEADLELSLTIMPDGSVGDLQVEFCSVPKRGFEETTIKAIKQWRYHPQLRAGIITARPDVRVKVRYRLDRAE